MGLFDKMFNSPQGQTGQQNQQGQAGQSQPQQQQSTGQPAPNQPNGGLQQPVNPAQSGGQDNPQPQQSSEPQGIDKFKDLWQPNQSKEDKGNQGASQEVGLALTQDALNPVLEKLDFSQSISQEALAKLQQGDLSVLPNLLQDVAKSTYATAMQHSTALVEKHLETKLSSLQDKLLNDTKSQITTQSAVQSIEIDHPLIKSELSRVASQLQQKYPDASPQWIAEQSKEYIQELAKAFGGGQSDNSDTSGQSTETEKPVDFLQYAGLDNQN